MQHPSIIFTKNHSTNGVLYGIKFKGRLLWKDIHDLGVKVREITKENINEKKIIHLDLAEADPELYKPMRLFGVCNKLTKKIQNNNLSIDVIMIMNKEQHKFAPLFRQLPIDVKVEENPATLNTTADTPTFQVGNFDIILKSHSTPLDKWHSLLLGDENNQYVNRIFTLGMQFYCSLSNTQKISELEQSLDEFKEIEIALEIIPGLTEIIHELEIGILCFYGSKELRSFGQVKGFHGNYILVNVRNPLVFLDPGVIDKPIIENVMPFTDSGMVFGVIL